MTKNSAKNKKIVNCIYISALFVLVLNEGVFWMLKSINHVEKSREHHTMIISTSLVMVGFLLRVTSMSVQGRTNDKLKDLRNTKEWAVMDASIIVGEILFLISGIWSFITMVYKWDDFLSYSFQT